MDRRITITFKEDFGFVIKSMKIKIEDKKKELQNEQDALIKLENFADGELSRKLTVASFEEITQEKYNKRIEELNQL